MEKKLRVTMEVSDLLESAKAGYPVYSTTQYSFDLEVGNSYSIDGFRFDILEVKYSSAILNIHSSCGTFPQHVFQTRTGDATVCVTISELMDGCCPSFRFEIY